MDDNIKIKNDLISVFSHELLTPLVITKGYIAMVLDRKVNKLDDETKIFLEKAYYGNERLITIVTTMIRTVDVDTNNIKFTIRQYPVEEVLSPLTKKYSLACKQKNIVFQTLSPNDNNLKVIVDLEKTREILDYILDNALKFTDRGEIIVNYEKKDKGGKQFVTISVKDTGVGISQEKIPLLFKKLAYGNLDFKEHRTGVGLGLYIAEKLTEAQHGMITVESIIDQGSTFYLYLPLTQ